MIFQAGYKFTLAQPGNDSSKAYSHLLMGERLGRLRAVASARH
jgi:hypothetical protein